MNARRLGAMLGVLAALIALATYSGHEVPIYPSYYPQEIRVEIHDPRVAGRLLAERKLHAYLGRAAEFTGAPPAHVAHVESLGSYLVLSLNRAEQDEATACALAQSLLRELKEGAHGLVFHPYPVTPLHADYLYHADRAAAARAHWLTPPGITAAARRPKVRAEGALAASFVPARWQQSGSTWDAKLEAIDAGELVAGAAFSTNGWSGPPWLKAGWFHAERLLAGAIPDAADRELAARQAERLRTGNYGTPEEEANLQRMLVRLLTGGCHRLVVGYTLKREHLNADYSTGIENIGYDSHAGLISAIFIRTVKLKDFPWNGWLRLGVDERAEGAWNPIAGFNGNAGRLLWLTIGDPALFPAPYAGGWELNRMADVQASPDTSKQKGAR